MTPQQVYAPAFVGEPKLPPRAKWLRREIEHGLELFRNLLDEPAAMTPIVRAEPQP